MKPADEYHLPGVLAAVIAVVLSLSVFVVVTSSNGTPIGIFDNGIGDHWPVNHRALTIVDRSGDPGWGDAISAAVSTWSEGGSALHFTVVTGKGDCRQSRDQIQICEATSEDISHKGAEGEQGLFVPRFGRRHDYRSAIVLVCSDCDIDQSRMTVIATHELGHALGLAHNPDPESVMYYLGGSPQPDSRDYQILRQLEGTVSPAPAPAPADASASAPASG